MSSETIDKQDLPGLEIPEGNPVIYGASPGSSPIAVRYNQSTNSYDVYSHDFDKIAVAERTALGIIKAGSNNTRYPSNSRA